MLTAMVIEIALNSLFFIKNHILLDFIFVVIVFIVSQTTDRIKCLFVIFCRKNWKSGQKRKLKFTYREQKDYESIEGEMAALEDKISALEADFSKYASDFVKLNELTQEKEAAEQQLEEKMERWMYLEDLAARIAEQ